MMKAMTSAPLFPDYIPVYIVNSSQNQNHFRDLSESDEFALIDDDTQILQDMSHDFVMVYDDFTGMYHKVTKDNVIEWGVDVAFGVGRRFGKDIFRYVGDDSWWIH